MNQLTKTAKGNIQENHVIDDGHNGHGHTHSEIKDPGKNIGSHMHHHHQSHQNGHGKHMENHEHHGHDHHKMMIEDFKKRFWISVLLSLPVLVLSPMIQQFFGFEVTFKGNFYVIFGLSTIIYFYGGWPFLTGLLSELKQKTPGMMTLIAVAITTAYVYSSAVVFGLEGKMFFWELVTLIDIMLLGHWIEMRSVMGASRALELLVNMMPKKAHRIKGDTIEEVELELLNIGNVVLVKPGEKIPADGRIVDGESFLNESMLTGESVPVRKEKDDKVIGGSINGNGSLKIEVEHTGEESYLNKVITLVQEAQKTKSKTQHLADRAAKWLTYVALIAGSVTLLVWLSLGYEFVYALERMVTVMVIACPHALGLAIPLVVAISTALSAQNGLLIRNRTAFENSRKISSIVFDKTGTLTEGDFSVSRYESIIPGITEEEILKFAGALESQSEHPIALGIVEKINAMELGIPESRDFLAITGKGVQATVEDREIKVVSPGYVLENGFIIPEGAFLSEAETVVFLVVDDELAGFIALADKIRPESAKAISTLRTAKINVLMATGDNEKTAKAVNESLELDGYYSEVLPHEKVEIVSKLQQNGEFVAMTGDGVNDAPALAQADVGIAVGSGTDVAAETADIVLVNSNPRDIANLILFGRATYDKMIQNLIWATAYNAFAIPLAAGVLYSQGIVLGPAVGAVFMSLSTIVVAVNAQLLKGKIKKLLK